LFNSTPIKKENKATTSTIPILSIPIEIEQSPPVGAKHRIINKQKHPLIFIEVQIGTYFGEDDIVRIEDIYDRK
jgi:hypothetical protein